MSGAEWVFWGAWAAVGYAYVGYPLLIAAAARAWGRQDAPALPSDRALPRVSVVFAAYNEQDVIEAKLANCRDLDYPSDRLEVLVGADGCTDATLARLRGGAGSVRCLAFGRRRGKVSVVNDLVKLCSGDIVVMTDASTLLDSDAVRHLVRPFADPRVGCVTGELSIAAARDVSGEGMYLRYERWIKRAEGRLGCVVGCVGANFAVRRSLYEPLPRGTIVEDLVVCLRILERGFLAVSAPAAHGTDPPCATARAEMGRKVRIGAGAYQAMGLAAGLLHPRHGVRAFAFWGHKVARWLVPFFVLAAGGANVALAARPGYAAALAALVAGAAVAAWAYRRPPDSLVPRWTRPISYFYLMNYALLRGFLRFLLRAQPVTWERAPAATPRPARAASPGSDPTDADALPIRTPAA